MHPHATGTQPKCLNVHTTPEPCPLRQYGPLTGAAWLQSCARRRAPGVLRRPHLEKQRMRLCIPWRRTAAAITPTGRHPTPHLPLLPCSQQQQQQQQARTASGRAHTQQGRLSGLVRGASHTQRSEAASCLLPSADPSMPMSNIMPMTTASIRSVELTWNECNVGSSPPAGIK